IRGAARQHVGYFHAGMQLSRPRNIYLVRIVARSLQPHLLQRCLSQSVCHERRTARSDAWTEQEMKLLFLPTLTDIQDMLGENLYVDLIWMSRERDHNSLAQER